AGGRRDRCFGDRGAGLRARGDAARGRRRPARRPAVGWLAALALLSQTAGWLLITSSLPRLPAAVSSLMLLLQPAASLAVAAVIPGQRPSVLQIVGAVLTCGGALAASLSSTRRAGEQSVRGNEAEHATAAETAA